MIVWASGYSRNTIKSVEASCKKSSFDFQGKNEAVLYKSLIYQAHVFFNHTFTLTLINHGF